MSAVAFNLYKPADTCLILVGLGLIGKAIEKYAGLYGQKTEKISRKFSWSSEEEIVNAICSLAQATGREKIELVWSSGSAGFSASNSDMQPEYDIFAETLTLLASRFDNNLTVNFLSSAGGIYEGLEQIQNPNTVAPVRPYGAWKLKQEELLSSLNLTVRNYRISSAYGFATGQTRFGLINNLIDSALINKNTLIYASPNTLRDYIFTPDIARFIIENIIDKRPPGTQIIASSRPVSVDMLISIISQLLRRHVKVTYSTSNTNSRDIIFPTAIIPQELTITSLEESIKLIMMSRFSS